MLRASLTVLLAALILSGSGASAGRRADPPTVQGRPTFFISGHGWGHGLGLSQYGAYGYALHGWKYDRILLHYYTGTTIGQAPVKRVRVLLAASAGSATIASKLPLQVVGADGRKLTLDAGSYKVGTAFKAKDPNDPTAKPQPLVYPLEFRPGTGVLTLNGRAYRGSLRALDPATGRVVWARGLSDIVWGGPTVDGSDVVAISYPGFFETLGRLVAPLGDPGTPRA